MKITTSFRKHAGLKTRIIVSQGGTSSGKTWGILLILLIILQKRQYKGVLISVVAETLPHLKKGAMRDFFKILDEEDIYDHSCHNKSDHTYTVGKSVIEFFSADQPHKVRGPRRDILFINECNNLPYETFEQLEIRTTEQVWLDFNPTQSFWVHEEVIPFMDHTFVKTTYLDNECLHPEIVKSIEKRRGRDANWWRIYGEGELGMIEGLVFPVFHQVQSFPETLDHWYGQDFGYTADPSTLIRIAIEKTSGDDPDKLFWDERFYQHGMTNKDITRRYDALGLQKYSSEIFADSAEPKSIDEIHSYGWNIKPVRKGPDSVINGIDVIKRYDLYVTKRSVNMIKELRNYMWIVDKNGQITNKPHDSYNHCIDAGRYGTTMKVQSPVLTPARFSVPRVGRRR